jgi:hypothetical protein
MVLVATDDLINRHSCVSLTIETEWYYLAIIKIRYVKTSRIFLYIF